MLKLLITFLQFFLLLHLSNLLVGIDGGRGKGCGSPGQLSQRRNKMSSKMILDGKKFEFMCSTIFKILRKISVNVINSDFFNVHTFF
jgi:hypothetical protein